METGVSSPPEQVATVGMIGFDRLKASDARETLISLRSMRPSPPPSSIPDRLTHDVATLTSPSQTAVQITGCFMTTGGEATAVCSCIKKGKQRRSEAPKSALSPWSSQTFLSKTYDLYTTCKIAVAAFPPRALERMLNSIQQRSAWGSRGNTFRGTVVCTKYIFWNG